MLRKTRMQKRVDTSLIGDFALGKLSPEESLKVLDAIENDPEASARFELITGLINVAESRGAEIFERGTVVGPELSRRGNLAAGLWSLLAGRKLVLVAALAGLCLGVIVVASLVSSLTLPKYYAYATVDGAEYVSGVRGLDEFAAAHTLIARGETDEATTILERYMRAFPQGEHVDYAHYLAGAAYLVSAHHSILTLFPSFDHDRAFAAIRHLEAAAGHSTNPRVKEESHWLLAKAWLMLGRSDEGIVELQNVLSLDGPRKTPASTLLKELQKAD
jgi:hypothetical protein